MPEWSKFTDTEIEAIKLKMNQKFEKGMTATIIVSPIICLVMPYFPGRKGPVIEKMPYWDAVIQMSIIWFVALIGIYIWNYYKSNSQFERSRKFLRKKSEITKITNKTKTFFSSFQNIISTELAGDLGNVKIDKEQSTQLDIGDEIKIEFEEQTQTILNLIKCKTLNLNLDKKENSRT